MSKVKPATLVKVNHAEAVYRQRSNPSSSNLDLMSHGSYHINPDVSSDRICHPDQELLLFAIDGKIKIEVKGQEYVMEHYDVLYIPVNTPYVISNIGEEESFTLAFKAFAENRHPVYFAEWKKVSADESRIRHLDGKDVFLMFDVSEGADKLIAGYTIYEPHTRAYPAHNHTDQEEIYLFSKGRGAMEVYEEEKNKTFVTSVDTMDSVTIPLLNYHPVFSQDEELHFIWCIAGERYWVGDKNTDFMKGDSAELTT
ncbi:MAG: 5-deoxy-glucuronate isomerase [Verrucomicrobiota bacterium]